MSTNLMSLVVPKSAPLPYDAEVEYLESVSANNFFNTLIESRPVMTISAGFAKTNGGTVVGWDGGNCATNYIDFRVNYYDSNIRVETGVHYEFVWEVGTGRNTQVKNISTGDVSVGGGNDATRHFTPIFIFARALNNDVCTGKIYYCKIETPDEGILFNGIPVRFTNENGVSEGAMYDKVSGQLFRNQGTGAFIIGPDKVRSLVLSKLFGDRKMVKQGYTARDYVQDGLVAMWDGIENAGWGVHDPNATVWKDLVGNRNLEVNHAYGSFEENCIVANGIGTVAYNQDGTFLTLNDECSIEIVLSVSPGVSEQAIFCASNSGSEGRIVWWYKNGIGWGYNGKSTPYVFGSKKLFSATFSSGERVADKTYQNAVEYIADSSPDYFTAVNGNISVSSSPTWTFTGRVFSIRVYGKKINGEIVAANYAIDKARFNLP